MINKAKSLIAAHRRRKRAMEHEQIKKKLGFPQSLASTPTPQQYRPKHSYSIVTAAYGAENYIDEFFSSLMQQTIGFAESLEVIIVDDGSTDGTLIKARAWENRFPDAIKVITQTNGGPAAARNTGLRYARNEWITFTDPDDFLAKDYFECVDRQLHENMASGIEVDMVACQIITYSEQSGSVSKHHPLNRSYASGPRVVSFHADFHNDIKLSAASSFFKRDKISHSKLTFPDIRPSFEDAAFIAQYLLASRSANVLFLPSSIYFYRKRAAKSSIIDTSWARTEKYTEQLERGYIPILSSATKKNGNAPRWLQRMVLYDLMWHMKHFTNQHKNWPLVPEKIRGTYRALLKETFNLIDEKNILDFDLIEASSIHKLGILSYFKGVEKNDTHVRIINVDHIKREIQLGFYHSADKIDLRYSINGVPVEPLASTVRTFEFLASPLVYETLDWIRWKGDGELSVHLGSYPLHIKIRGADRLSVCWSEVAAAKRKHILNEKSMPWEKRLIRRASQLPAVKKRYRDAWILMDRDTKADDNAEHLYRYLKKHYPQVNAWFALRKSSPDWERLSKEGFKMLNFGSPQHKLALLNATHLLSSHADHYLFSILPAKYYADQLKYRFTFLQHGVIHNDLSGWLNSKSISCFLTTAEPEFKSLTAQGNYKFTSKEVSLTGLPRHDNLLKLAQERIPSEVKTVVIMPTWRHGLVGEALGHGNARAYNPELITTNFYHSWKNFLSHPKLKVLAKESQVEFIFLPHPNLEPYISHFDVGWMTLASYGESSSIQEILVHGDLLITDFSSIAFDFALLEKPILYYQFDREFMFSGGHTSRKGYFDFDTHGFGPVSFSANDLVEQVAQLLSNQFKVEPKYAKRMNDFFPFRDGKNCDRVIQRVLSLDSPAPSVIDALPDAAPERTVC